MLSDPAMRKVKVRIIEVGKKLTFRFPMNVRNKELKWNFSICKYIL